MSIHDPRDIPSEGWFKHERVMENVFNPESLKRLLQMVKDEDKFFLLIAIKVVVALDVYGLLEIDGTKDSDDMKDYVTLSRKGEIELEKLNKAKKINHEMLWANKNYN